MSGKALNLTVGWYGKIPGVGDFASRGVSRETLEILDNWVQDGLLSLERSTEEWLSPFLNSPVWNMIVPAGKLSRLPMIGCIAPSCDRIGRGFPLTLMLSGPESTAFCSLIKQSTDWLTCTREILQQAIKGKYLPDQFDQRVREMTANAWSELAEPLSWGVGPASDILDIIGLPDTNAITVPLASGVLPWPELPSFFSDQKDLSYWWATPTPNHPGTIPVIHKGPLDGALFCRLFNAKHF